jgi:hypothetical protein
LIIIGFGLEILAGGWLAGWPAGWLAGSGGGWLACLLALGVPWGPWVAKNMIPTMRYYEFYYEILCAKYWWSLAG